ncbi:hypothetical protein ACS0TR_18760, partial [Serratia marcescens]
MANSLPESPTWVDKIFQLETDTPVLGGTNGPDNWQAQQLANRTAYLKLVVDILNMLVSSSGIGAYDSPEKAQAAIDAGTEKRKFFQVWSDKEGVWTEKYENINGIATPTGQSLKDNEFVTEFVADFVEKMIENTSLNSSKSLAEFKDRDGNVYARFDRSGELWLTRLPVSLQSFVEVLSRDSSGLMASLFMTEN